MTEVTPVAFGNAEGHRLFGILHMPDARYRQSTAIVLLSPGVKMRVAPHRLYNDMADVFAGMGYPVLRFDFAGLGDAEGTMEDTLLADLYGKVQVGCYKADTVAAMDWLDAEHGLDRFVLAGLCGGAITGLLTGAEDGRVKGLLALGIPVILDNADVDASQYVTRGQLKDLRRGYIQRLLSPKSWLRLLTFQTDFGMLFRSLLGRGKTGAAEAGSADGEAAVPDNFNTLFPEAFFGLVANERPVCLVFSGADRLHYEYEEKFVARYGERLSAPGLAYETHVIEHANHILSAPEHKSRMLEIAGRWLSRHFA